MSDLPALLEWLNALINAQRTGAAAPSDEMSDSVRQLERARVILQEQELGTSEQAIDDVRRLIAVGMLRWMSTQANVGANNAEQLIAVFVGEALWMFFEPCHLPEGWFGALRQISSEAVVREVQGRLWVYRRDDPAKSKAELIRALAHPKCRTGILNLLEDMADTECGLAILAATMPEAYADIRKQPDKKSRVKKWIEWAAIASVGGVIGNRSDAGFVKLVNGLWEWLTQASVVPTQSPLTQSAPPSPAPQRVGTQSNVLRLTHPINLEMIRIPASEFWMGSSNNDKSSFDDEKPIHRVYLDEYYIGKYAVTVNQFAAFVSDTSYVTWAERERWEWTWRTPRGKGSHVRAKGNNPVTQVTWQDAVQFCEWLSRRTHMHFGLPTEAQWEKAARGDDTNRKGQGIYPWGDTPPTDKRCNFKNNVGDTTRVGAYSPLGDSPYGCADMSGNVWEWCVDVWNADEYKNRAGLVVRNPRGDSYGDRRVVRGGSLGSNGYYLRCACRSYGGPGLRYDIIGFRLFAPPS